MTAIKTGVFLPTETVERIKELKQIAQTTPAILLSQRHLGPYGKTESELAWDHFCDTLNNAAVAAGLPTPRTITDDDGDLAIVNYGLAPDGEVLGWEP